MKTGRVRVFIAMSLDGFIAAENDDLSWLPQPSADADPVAADHGFTAFLAQVGALLMGRRTFDVVAGFTGEWPYGDRPVLVATSRPLQSSLAVAQQVHGTIESIVAQALHTAGGKDVYIDGGALIRSAMDAKLVDELIITVIPVLLGKGIPLFAGVASWHRLKLIRSEPFDGGLLQLTYEPSRE